MLPLYQRTMPFLSEFFRPNVYCEESKIEIVGDINLVTHSEGDPSESDLENVVIIHRLLGEKLSRVQASDARLWTYLCHETYWEYMKWRWPVDRASIKSRYFVNGNDSRALSRNGIARLWWFGHLTYDNTRINPYELTEVFLWNQNIQHNLLERSFGRNRVILHGVLEFMKREADIFNGSKAKANVERLAKAINIRGGVILLDCLSKTEVLDYLDKVF